jgi:tryptophan halogenase
MWHIPLATSNGLGYVFSSSFVSDDEAWQHMLAAAPGLESSGAQPRFLAMRVGRQSHFWKDNVLAVGLSAAFVEPLESTGLHLTQSGLQTFLQRLPHGHDWRAVRDSYNQRMGALCDHVRDFIQLHYHLSRRSDSAFWNAARSAPLSDELVDLLRLYDDAGILDLPRADIFPDTSWYHILTGNDRLPRRADRLSLAAPHSAVRQTLAAIDEQNRRAVSQFPRHEDLLPLWRRGPLARAS